MLTFRSPGGTPLRPDKPKLSDSQDPATLIAEALKRKFAGRVLHSPCTPDTDKEMDGSPDSPLAPVSGHCLDFFCNFNSISFNVFIATVRYIWPL